MPGKPVKLSGLVKQIRPLRWVTSRGVHGCGRRKSVNVTGKRRSHFCYFLGGLLKQTSPNHMIWVCLICSTKFLWLRRNSPTNRYKLDIKLYISFTGISPIKVNRSSGAQRSHTISYKKNRWIIIWPCFFSCGSAGIRTCFFPLPWTCQSYHFFI